MAFLDFIRQYFFWNRGLGPMKPESIKASRERFLTQSTISTFVAVVQVTTLADSFGMGQKTLTNTPTTLQVVTNAFSFAGIIYNVSSAFFSLASVTALITREQKASLFYDLLSHSSGWYELDQIMRPRPDPGNPTSPIGLWLYMEARHLSSIKPKDGRDYTNEDIALAWKQCGTAPFKFRQDADHLGQSVAAWLWVGEVAAIVAQVGVACFFTSVICLTVEAQTKAVWVTTAAVIAPAVIISAIFSLFNWFTRRKDRRLRDHELANMRRGNVLPHQNSEKSETKDVPDEGKHFPGLVLVDEPLVDRMSAIDVFIKLFEYGPFRNPIKAYIPQILSLVIALLRDSDYDVRRRGASVLAKLSQNPQFRESIKARIPLVIALLSAEELRVRRSSAWVLANLSEYPEFREPIKACIPQVIALLSVNILNVRRSSALALAKLSEHAEFHKEIKECFPQLVHLLESDLRSGVEEYHDDDVESRSAAVK
ncbi:hypothetical protein K443DRAFT_675984 [Laccaria amethystina LaAM-08-1]|uniref:Uncharacterized protein n=1 Tax=Laccaria amethystina LaAM-08-1 TaxID=1095629 RepID=A0A0C9XHC7_9AGAR|nr:hypothetical protein K443DRAFT_675984 [Laccaria amethystina LaAM-08-1]